MRVLLLANNRVAVDVARCIREQGDSIVGVVLHPKGRRKCGDQILAAAQMEDAFVVDASELSDPLVLQQIAGLSAEIGVSCFFGYILRPFLLDGFPLGCINLHPALLPCNRGSFPNVWSIVDGTPAGATLHYIDAGLDTGDIVAQQEVAVEFADTGETLYRKLEAACAELFRNTWPSIRAGSAARRPQTGAESSCHKKSDVARIDAIDLDQVYTARNLLNILRARTFQGYRGAYVVENGRKIYIELQLTPET
jgi:methionyl-tRNA formyltransferase